MGPLYCNLSTKQAAANCFTAGHISRTAPEVFHGGGWTPSLTVPVPSPPTPTVREWVRGGKRELTHFSWGVETVSRPETCSTDGSYPATGPPHSRAVPAET